jgi:hypothetical protein
MLSLVSAMKGKKGARNRPEHGTCPGMATTDRLIGDINGIVTIDERSGLWSLLGGPL